VAFLNECLTENCWKKKKKNRQFL